MITSEVNSQGALTLIAPVIFEEDQISALEAKLAASCVVVKEIATKKYGAPKIKKLRDAYKKYKSCPNRYVNPLATDPVAAQNFDWIISQEDLIIRLYVRMTYELCESFYLTHRNELKIEFDDFQQEALIAIYNAIYTYRIDNKFTTYVYWCIKNKLIDFVKKMRKNAGNSQRITNIRRKIHRLMGEDCSMTFEKACQSLKVPQSDIDKLEDVRQTKYLSDLQSGSLTSTNSDEDDTEQMCIILRSLNLSDIELQLIDAYLKSDTNFRARFAESEICPSTNRHWTKANLSRIFVEACKKLKEAYELKKAA